MPDRKSLARMARLWPVRCIGTRPAACASLSLGQRGLLRALQAASFVARPGYISAKAVAICVFQVIETTFSS